MTTNPKFAALYTWNQKSLDDYAATLFHECASINSTITRLKERIAGAKAVAAKFGKAENEVPAITTQDAELKIQEHRYAIVFDEFKIVSGEVQRRAEAGMPAEMR